MISVTTERFRKAYAKLPENIQEAARKAYGQWKVNSNHPGLQFKQIHKTQQIYSVRIGLAWRGIGVKNGNTIIWFWIGSHADYDKLIASL
ncbi:MAG: ParE family toxin-like protein [Bacteroidota bacterium]